LRFASTAKLIKNKPVVNEVMDDQALLRSYKRKINELQKELEEVSADRAVVRLRGWVT
jgi:hypothetical protein